MQQRKALRQHFRQQRNALSTERQKQASNSLLNQLSSLPVFQQARTIALYLANDGEMDLGPVIDWCWAHGKQVVLPVLHPFSQGYLVFMRYQPSTAIRLNRFGIPEPLCEAPSIVPLDNLDLILTPLVAFDEQGNRLGMGGGFYDRTLAPVMRDKLNITLAGVAHDCQRAEQLPSDNWDIPLSAIITPSRVISCD